MNAERPIDGPLRDLQRVQFRRKLAIAISAAVATAALSFCRSLWRSEASGIYLFIQHIGVALILTSIAGRTWCAIYIGGKKNRRNAGRTLFVGTTSPLSVFGARRTRRRSPVGAQSSSRWLWHVPRWRS